MIYLLRKVLIPVPRDVGCVCVVRRRWAPLSLVVSVRPPSACGTSLAGVATPRTVGVLLFGCLGLVWALGSLSGVVRLSHSVGQGHPGLWGVLLSECLDLVWALDSLSGVV